MVKSIPVFDTRDGVSPGRGRVGGRGASERASDRLTLRSPEGRRELSVREIIHDNKIQGNPVRKS